MLDLDYEFFIIKLTIHFQYRKITLIIGILLTDIPLVIYAWINTKYIKFKDWITTVLDGYRILRYFIGWSIFIRNFRSPKRSKLTPNNQEDEEDYSYSESFNVGIAKDYDETSEFMRNYKQKYAINYSLKE